jgi:Fungal protein of unknown function (DUF1774)
MLWVRGWFWLAEFLLIINLFNLTALYFRHSTGPRSIHIPIVSAPYAWTYVAILWTGAAMVHAHSLAARILANIAIWGILVFGVFFLLAFKDYSMGFELAVLSLCKFEIPFYSTPPPLLQRIFSGNRIAKLIYFAALALAQLGTHVVAFQWIFAFVIMACLTILSVLIGVPGLFGERDSIRREGQIVEPDRERQPLLDDQ